MGMDITGASLQTGEVREITKTIQEISQDIEDTMKNVSETMGYLTGHSEGGVIEQATEAVKQLNDLVETLVACIINIGLKIGDFLKAMITQDQEAADRLRSSVESRVYG